MDISSAFRAFETAVRAARADPNKKKAIGECFQELLRVSDKSKQEIKSLTGVGRATIDRWVQGASIPHPSQVKQIAHHLLGLSNDASDRIFLSVCLLNPVYRPVIKFLLEEEGAGRSLDKEQLGELLALAERCKGSFTIEMMRAFLGIQPPT